MFRIGLLLCFWSTVCMAQYTYTVPDLKGENGESVALGVVNVEQASIEVTMRGYAASGEHLVEFKTQFSKFERLEGTAQELFGNDDVVWARLESTGKLAGYMRFSDNTGHLSLAPIVEWAGGELFISQPDPLDDVPVRTTLVNTASTDGEVFYQPFVTNKNNQQEQAAEPVALQGFGAAGGQITFSYDGSTFKESSESLVWDRLFGDQVSLAGVHRMGENVANQPKAAMVPPFNTYRSMVVSGGMQGFTGVTNADLSERTLVLVNTNPETMTVEMEAHFDASKYQTIVRPQDYEPYWISFDMAPFEKREFKFNRETDGDFPLHAAWYRITPNEAGLVGYLAVRDPNTGAIAAVEGSNLAGNVSNLPYTPSTDALQTRIVTINTSDQVTHVNWVGFDDTGRMRGFRGLRCEPYTRYVATTEELFGANAANITWTRVYTQTFELATVAEVHQRNGQDLALLSGQISQFGRGEVAAANMEFFSMEELFGHGWLAYYLPTDLPRYILEYSNNVPSQARLLNHPTYAYPAPGNFFIDNYHLPPEGYFSVGYEPILIQRTGLKERIPDRVALLSPFIQVPSFGDLNLRYQMRMTDPQRATEGSRYGILVQEEGAEDFYWFGLYGEVLQRPPLIIGDCWEDVRYRNGVVTLTPWWQFEGKLPERFKGKRVRIGMFYDHDTTKGPDQPGPRLFMDNIRITADQLRNAIFFEPSSGYDEGTFPLKR